MILGHSFVRRIEAFLTLSGIMNAALGDQEQVKFIHHGGCMVESFYKEAIQAVSTIQPTHVIIDIDTNELSKIQSNVFVVISHIQFLIQSVLYLPIISHNLKTTKYECRPDFESVRVIVNDSMAEYASVNDKVFFRKQNRLENGCERFVGGDGVHLNNHGLHLY